MSMERIMVTGGAGFIGSNLVRRLQETCPDAAILVIDDFRSSSFDNLAFGHDEPGGCFRGEVIARNGEVIAERGRAEVPFRQRVPKLYTA